MTSHWHFNPAYGDRESCAVFRSLSQVFSLDGELVTTDPESEVLRVWAGQTLYYVKRYTIGRRKLSRRWFGLRDVFGPQRAVKEWQNLLRFRDWGIPTASLVAYGQERRFGRFVRAALVTEALPDTIDLAELAIVRDSRLNDRAWVRHVSTQIASHARIMHRHGFVHNDLKWRNLLVGVGPRPIVYLIDCPNGARWLRPFLDYRIVKDLACLDKVAKHVLTRTQRLRFYLDYLGHDRLTDVDKRQLRKVLKFFTGRE